MIAGRKSAGGEALVPLYLDNWIQSLEVWFPPHSMEAIMDIVRTYNLSGKFISEQHFSNAEKAHNEYKNIIENAKNNLPAGFGIHVIRFVDEKIMAMETIEGTK